jgi:hypothetical protein
MIHFVVRRAAKWSVETYLESWGESLASDVGILCYEDLPQVRELPHGSYIFTERDGLLPSELELASVVARQLSLEAGARVSNDPAQVFGRHDLLRTLHERGLNDFQAVRATESTRDLRFPVFVREERLHTGSLTDLIHTRSELDLELATLFTRGWRRRDLLVVEYCDTADGRGVFGKYSAFVVGSEIIPRSLVFSKGWMVKGGTKFLDEGAARAELDYVRSNPHASWLRDVFAAAHVEYGRVDYALKGNRPQVWEINLCPTLVVRDKVPRPGSEGIEELRRPGRALFFQRFEAALRAIDTGSTSGKTVGITVSEALLRDLREDQRRERTRTFHHRVAKKLSRWRILHFIWRGIRPLAAWFASLAAKVSEPR